MQNLQTMFKTPLHVSLHSVEGTKTTLLNFPGSRRLLSQCTSASLAARDPYHPPYAMEALGF